MISTSYLFAVGAPFRDRHSWKRAYSYSGVIHGAALLFLLIMGVQTKEPVQTVLTEIKFVERPSVTAPEAKEAPKQIPVLKRFIQGGRGGFGASTPKRVPKARGKDELPPTEMSSPRGQADGQVVSPVPLAGPIVASGDIGTLGKKRGALIELAGRTGGTGAKGGLVVPAGTDDRFNNKPITLAKADYDAMRAQEKSIGVPLVSQNVMSEGLGGRSKELMATAIGGRKKAGAEDLKANPLDKDKWGKSKGPFSMEGPLKYRKILKMELPPYPRWAEDKAIETSVSIRIWVDPKGKVKDNMYLEKTSGYAELDSLAMQALARFFFVRIPDDQPQEDEWGVATFRFELKK